MWWLPDQEITLSQPTICCLAPSAGRARAAVAAVAAVSTAAAGAKMLLLCLLAATSSSAGGPLPANESSLLPPWPPSYSLARSTLCWGTNFTGDFNHTLASKFGLVVFGQSDLQLEWAKNVDRYNATNDEEAHIRGLISRVKADHPESATRFFMYRSGQVALNRVSAYQAVSSDPMKAHWWLSYQNGSRRGEVYSEVRVGAPGAAMLSWRTGIHF